jgi:hypothetical protein
MFFRTEGKRIRPSQLFHGGTLQELRAMREKSQEYLFVSVVLCTFAAES